MAVVTVAHQPELTPEKVMDVFSRHFPQEFEVYKTGFFGRDFVVKKNGWTGVGVKLKQDTNGTSFVFTALMPNVLLNLLFGGLLSFVLLRASWKGLERDVREFIENAPDFK